MISERLEKTENITIQDVALAEILGVSEDKVLELDLFQTKNKLQCLAWRYEAENIKITKEEADILDKKFQDIMMELDCISNIDFSGDYWIDFSNYVDDGKVKRFSYTPCEGYTETIK